METLLGTDLFAIVIQISRKFPFLSPLAYLFIPPKIIAKVSGTINMNSQEIQKRIDNMGKTRHPDFIDYMLPTDAPQLTKKQKTHLEQVALQLFVAGFDPIQLVFFGCLFFILKEPDVLDSLVQEIRSKLKTYDEITAEAVATLPYLNACIHETLRLHAVSSAGLPRTSPGAVVDGTYVPKGVSFVMFDLSPITHSPYLPPIRLSARPVSSQSHATHKISTIH
jgi:cytochrome P450